MPKFHPLQVKDIRRETDESVSIAFEIPKALKSEFEFIPGQYLTLKTEINGEEVRRNYSVCVSPLDGELRVAVKQVPFGKFSTFANQELQVGDRLEVMPPMGRFFKGDSSANNKEYVGFAGGSGITPIISILKSVLQSDTESSFTLFYVNRGFDSIIFREQIEGLKNEFLERLTVHHIFTREKLEAPLFNGRITKEKTLQFAKFLFDPSKVDDYFICGPEEMMLAIRDALEQIGVDRKKIHLELFNAGTQKPKVQKPKTDKPNFDGKTGSQVTIILDGDRIEFPLEYGGNSVLDVALEKGADLPYACKGGVCCTCRAKLIEGEVEMDVNYALEPEEVEAGFILTCQSHPRTAKIVVDFDEK
jgi:ring-1,2-phenylacetyl-CoA epoxidase subunit PaaE